MKTLQEYSFQKEGVSERRHQLIIERNPQVTYDCIQNELKVRRPPPIEVDTYSKIRSNYYHILATQNKPFNLKQGLFTNFTDRTKKTIEVAKAFRELDK